jgi:hypothetical protein
MKGFVDEPDAPARHPLLGHRCYEESFAGVVSYNPSRSTRSSEGVACIELPESFATDARARFKERHNIELVEPEFGFHMTIFRGPVDSTAEVERLWGHLEGERVTVQATREFFWKERFVWVNCFCPEYFLLRETLGGLDCSDRELWGHATIGTFPPGSALPRFLDYTDLADWGFRP